MSTQGFDLSGFPLHSDALLPSDGLERVTINSFMLARAAASALSASSSPYQRIAIPATPPAAAKASA
jgi:hypothetical protein